jgi:Fe-S-cluster containining protein
MPDQRATIHLRVLGRELRVSLDLPQQNAAPHQLLPAAYAISDAIGHATSEASAAAGKPVSCKPGCAACCRQMVPVAPAEAVALARIVDSLPPARRREIQRRFASAIARVRHAALVDPDSPDDAPILCAPDAGSRDASRNAWLDAYFYLGIDCPFLENETCTIYEQRPAICREYLITSPPENCRHAGLKETVGLDLPFRMSDALAGFAAPEKLQIPLIFALAWARAHAPSLQQAGNPRQLLTTLLQSADSTLTVPFHQRT